MRTILAPGRARRPEEFTTTTVVPRGGECPFCEGHEERTPPEVWAHRPDGGAPDTPGWTARAVPNLYPALADRAADAGYSGTTGEAGAFTDASDPLLASRRAGEADLWSWRPALGAHEVIVNGPDHVTALSGLSDEHFSGAIDAWRERMRAHPDASYVQLIVNEGGGAGASLEHSHAQLYALPFVPAAVARERERTGSYRERTGGGSLLSDILSGEVQRKERLVAIDDDAALICPWASRSPFELRVIPRRQADRFEDDDAGTSMLRTALRLLAERFGGPPELNLWVRTAPPGGDHFHWHIDIAPRLTIRAGFELGTGVDINICPPEHAAAELRSALG